MHAATMRVPYCINVPHDLCDNLPQGHVFRINPVHAATMHIWMHRLCNVVSHYIQLICSNFDKLFFVIDCTRRKVVNMPDKKVSGV